MGIKKISIHNFRGFSDGEIELKPLTVLLGPNSAGKSSFGHALAAMAHAHRLFSGTPQASLTPTLTVARTWPIDLGSLDDLRTNGASGPVKVGIETDSGLIEIGFGVDPLTSLLPSYFRFPKGEESGGSQTVSMVNPLDRTNTSPAGQTGTLGPKVIYESAEGSHYEVRRLNELQWEESGVPSTVILDGLSLKSITHERGTAILLSGKARKELEFLFQNLSYLRATRHRPSRTYPAGSGIRPARKMSGADSPQEIGYAGERAAGVLHRRAGESVQYAKLPNIPNTIEEARRQQGERASLVSGSLLAAVSAWLHRLELADSLRTDLSGDDTDRLEILVTLPGQSERNWVEIGFGTSQVVPILTAGLLQGPGSVFIVDLPEAHLHPRPQADLADFFCSLALSGRFSLVETHSEMFFHRLRLRAEMDDDLRDKISVYFIDKPVDGLCCQPRRVGLGLDEQLRWPVGFLQEAWEAEGQIEAVRQSKKESTRK